MKSKIALAVLVLIGSIVIAFLLSSLIESIAISIATVLLIHSSFILAFLIDNKRKI
ncbi:hypothetical protein [Alkalicoccobacillus plakortidis]|uniref:Uncharacterized protein n=1 Tax=Alkalicoccobacillus plakortidis TaxID=444060 RepID=A0ABT0XH21_9BACI|nr:hypothetical protein [Alkalicoccobacillus plakortidis]MCM2675188.1 hypothetical protein [Alkalicoccobacillus plakortidis]